MTTASPRWFKSSYSGTTSNCVEVAINLVASHGTVPVRDSKVSDGPSFSVSASAFSSFVAGVKGGRLGV
ncbi:hypothetical protein SLA_1595 [Streptomyces laurentii]|uniref:DUF397 domain-containing protein n=1 Tax=Streptomyces laurentii TaxID=39478 RepID=A0A160NXJ1_STRLU|nr:hypothetical protein SLA_1595 [Streptomyces laurentii]